MEIIDCHMHFSSIQVFKSTAKNISGVEYSKVGLERSFYLNNIVKGIGMGLTETAPGKFPDADSVNPMKLDLDDLPEKLYTCLGINPVKLIFDKDHQQLLEIEDNIDSRVVGFKIYPGYYPYPLTDPCYQLIYQLAEKHQLPIIIHCGDTFCSKGHLSFSHPLEVNIVAMQHRQVNFIMAHFGNPWVIDAAMVISNNPNVYADLSGLTIGNTKAISQARKNQLLQNHIKTGIAYIGDYSKLMFGSDWPLVQLESYISYIKSLIPPEHHQQVFYDNAQKVFPW